MEHNFLSLWLKNRCTYDTVIWSNVQVLSSLNRHNLKKHINAGPSYELMLGVLTDFSAEIELLS